MPTSLAAAVESRDWSNWYAWLGPEARHAYGLALGDRRPLAQLDESCGYLAAGASTDWFAEGRLAPTVTADGPPVYPFKTVIPVAGVFLLLQGFVEIVRCIICIKQGEWPSREIDVEEVDVDVEARAIAAHAERELLADAHVE